MRDSNRREERPLLQCWNACDVPPSLRRAIGNCSDYEWVVLIPAEFVGTEISEFLAGAGAAWRCEEFPGPDGARLLAGTRETAKDPQSFISRAMAVKSQL